MDMNEFSFIGRLLIVAGVLLLTAGSLLLFGPRVPFLGRLPGDIHISGKNFDFYLPIATCIVVSLLLSLLFYLIRWFR